MTDKCQNCGLYKTRCLNAEAKVELLEKAIGEKNEKLRCQRAYLDSLKESTGSPPNYRWCPASGCENRLDPTKRAAGFAGIEEPPGERNCF